MNTPENTIALYEQKSKEQHERALKEEGIRVALKKAIDDYFTHLIDDELHYKLTPPAHSNMRVSLHDTEFAKIFDAKTSYVQNMCDDYVARIEQEETLEDYARRPLRELGYIWVECCEVWYREEWVQNVTTPDDEEMIVCDGCAPQYAKEFYEFSEDAGVYVYQNETITNTNKGEE